MTESDQAPSNFHPIVKWGQREKYVLLSVLLQDSENVQVVIENEHLIFSAIGNGAQGRLSYGFELDYYLPVVATSSRYVVTGRSVLIKLRKQLKDAWPRLTAQSVYLPWMRVDFDVYQFEASDLEQSDAGEEAQLLVNVVHPSKEERAKHNAEMKALEDEEEWDAFMKILKNPLTIYLLLFNLFQLAGRICVFGVLISYLFGSDGGVETVNNKRWFYSAFSRLFLVQLIAFLEPLHAVLKWVHGGIRRPLLQAADRGLILFMIVLPHEDLHSISTTFWLFFCWLAVDLVRYPSNIVSILGMRSGFLKYLRFTLWIPFLPIAFICEGKLIILAIPSLMQSGRFSLPMPNSLNMTFDFPIFLHIYLIIKLASFYYLMRHTYVQRRRIIGPHPRIGSDQMGFFSFIPVLRSMLGYEKKKPLHSSLQNTNMRNSHLPKTSPRASLTKQN